jgi:chromosome segregation ATPase
MDTATLTDLKQFITTAISQQTSDLRQDISGIKLDISELKEDVAGFKDDMVTVKQDVSGLRDDVTSLKQDVSSLNKHVKRIDKKIDDLSLSVAEALDASNEAIAIQLQGHEQRITRLEHTPRLA